MKADWNSIKQKIERDFPNIPMIATKQLAQWMNDVERQPIIFDARGLEEFNVSHLRGAVQVADAKVAAKAIEDLLNTSTTNANQSHVTRPAIVVYCSVGYRSAKVVDQLFRAGIENIYNLEGSIFQWFNEGRPVFQGDVQVDEVHPYDANWGELLNRK